ncbi:hypothetical protein [Nocardia tenerifensis]|uniref:hypothetical protein n=1 Tax=Nocardia tenerifensis TaxID=228006 RepID=UPI0005949C4A|nr:hypothetical protein [Nocardia tenerifensis]
MTAPVSAATRLDRTGVGTLGDTRTADRAGIGTLGGTRTADRAGIGTLGGTPYGRPRWYRHPIGNPRTA